MNQQKIKYIQVMNLGFEEEESPDTIYFEEFGYPYVIITKNLTKRIAIDWVKETQLAEMVRYDKEGKVLSRLKIKDYNHLREMVEFFTVDKK